MSGEVWEVWGAYHERERLCPEGVRVREIAHVHYACESYAGFGPNVHFFWRLGRFLSVISLIFFLESGDISQNFFDF